MIAQSGDIMPDGLPYGLPIMNLIHLGMVWHKMRAKKNRHIRRLFSWGWWLNGREGDTEDHCYEHAGRDQCGDHGPIIITFNGERVPVFIF